MKQSAGKVALVTGASKGIGAGIAKGLAVAGFAVVVNYVSSKEGADSVVAEISRSGGQAAAIQGDVSKSADVERLFEQARSLFGKIDVLVNNAAVYKFGPVESVTEEDFHQHFNTNVLSVYLTTQAASKQFGDAGGNIINIVTAGIDACAPMTSLYTATKTAVVTLTRVMAKELGPRKIRVNAIAAGVTRTEGLDQLGFVGSPMEQQAVAATPLGRLGEPEDIAPIAVFLASDASGWITGDTLFASGGLK